MEKELISKLKYQIYLIDQEIKDLKKQKKIYVDELKLIECRKTKKKKKVNLPIIKWYDIIQLGGKATATPFYSLKIE